jgi:MYXO-CTERM domain-containing protein
VDRPDQVPQPPARRLGRPAGGGEPPAIAARDLAFVPRDQPLRSFLKKELADETALPGDPVKVDPYPRALNRTEPDPQQGPGTAAPLDPGPPVIATQPPASSGCASCDTTAGTGLASLGLLAVTGLLLRRRRGSPS